MQANLTYHTPTVESISELVHAFYADARQDALLGPVFDEALNGQWDGHLHRLVDFWSTVLLGSRSFNRPLKKWASNASGTLFSKKRVAQTRLRSDCTGQSGLFAGHLAHFGRTYPRAHA